MGKKEGGRFYENHAAQKLTGAGKPLKKTIYCR